jgi:hypothetical protein
MRSALPLRPKVENQHLHVKREETISTIIFFYKVHRYVVIPAGTLANYSGVSKNMRLA